MAAQPYEGKLSIQISARVNQIMKNKTIHRILKLFCKLKAGYTLF